jgi:hypothetical protein
MPASRAVPVSRPVESGSEAGRPICRPGIALFVRYCYGGRLPERHHSWVLRDVTCRTWVLRHFARWMMVIIPVFALYMALMPTSFGIRVYTDIAVCGGIFMFALVNILIDTDRRAVRAGYSFNLPGEIRATRADDRQRLANHERRQRVAERQVRRRR